MAGQHRYVVSGSVVRLDVESVKAMAQPEGTFFAWGLNDQGKWVRDQSALRAPVAICDIGFHTLDLFTVEGGEVVARFTGGDTVGMRRAAELIVNRLSLKAPVWAMDQVVADGCEPEWSGSFRGTIMSPDIEARTRMTTAPSTKICPR